MRAARSDQLIGYVRSRSAGPSLGPSARRRLSQYCLAHGYRLADCLFETDPNVHRLFERRPIGALVLERIRSGTAIGIVAPELADVFSSLSDAIEALACWLEEGIDLHIVDFDGAGSEIRLSGRGSTAALVRGLAFFHRRATAERASIAGHSRRARGTWLGRVPYGFRVEQGRLVENPERIANILAMKRARHRGKSYREIARQFGISVTTTHRLINTDLRRLRRIGRTLDRPASSARRSRENGRVT